MQDNHLRLERSKANDYCASFACEREGEDTMIGNSGAGAQQNEGGSNRLDGGVGGGTQLKGPWTAAEDAILADYVRKHGEGNWNARTTGWRVAVRAGGSGGLTICVPTLRKALSHGGKDHRRAPRQAWQQVGTHGHSGSPLSSFILIVLRKFSDSDPPFHLCFHFLCIFFGILRL
ncbi:hypothetical protein SLA2020_325920 [Shorea laevis]